MNEPMSVLKIPDGLFLPVIQLRDISTAKIKPLKERKPGEPDIIIKDIFGNILNISRFELIESYRYLNGGKINLSSWKNNKEIYVVRSADREMYGLFVGPKNILCIPGDAGEKVVDFSEYPNGAYILCDAVDSEIDRETYYIIPKKIFTKTCAMQGSLKRNIEEDFSLSEIYDKITEKRRIEKEEQEKERKSLEEKQSKLKARRIEEQKILKELEGKQSSYDSYAEQDDTLQPINATIPINALNKLKTQDCATLEKSTEHIKYSIKAKLLRNEVLVGFVLEIQNNRTVKISLQKAMELADNNKLSNVGIRRLNGKPYLYGIGIKLSELEEIHLE